MPFREAVRAWFAISLQTFGGPAGQIAVMQREQEICPTLVCGPSGGGMHAVGEWVDLRQVRALATALTTVLGDWRPDAD